MPIQTYTDLQAAVADWLARADLSARIPDFIMLFETVANRRLRVRQQEAAATLALMNGVAALPADYLAWRRVTWTGNIPRELEYVHPSYLHALFPTLPQGNPRYFTIEGGNLTLGPSDDTAIAFDYFQKIPALAALAGEVPPVAANWLLAAYPDLYLFGALAEAYAYAKDPDNMALWGGRRDAIFDEIERLDAKTRAPAALRVMGPTP
jgi:hypothetical protein